MLRRSRRVLIFSLNTGTVLYCTRYSLRVGYTATESMDEQLYSSRNASIRTPLTFSNRGFVEKFKQKYYTGRPGGSVGDLETL